MNPKLTQLIDQYLSGALSPEEKADFETRLANNADLRSEVELQKNVMDAAKRASQRARIKKSAKQYRSKRLLKQSGLSILVIGLFTATTLFLMSAFSNEKDANETLAPISKELKKKLDKNQDFDNIPIQYFQVPSNGSIQLSEQGVLISVPESAFLKDGKPFKGNVILQYQEAIEGVDIVKSGLSTMTGDELLETQGMFSVAGYTEEGRQLEFNPEVGVYIQSPIDNEIEGMQLYDGNKLADGTIDWQNPVPFEKIPIAADMSDLDFYPVCYEDHLDDLKWNREKKSRDSLYLTLEYSQLSKQVTPQNIESESNLLLTSEEAVITIEEDKKKGAVYRTLEQCNVAAVPITLAWDFSVEMLGSKEAFIVAKSNIPNGYYILSSQNDPEKSKKASHAFRIICPNTPSYIPVGETEDVSVARRKVNNNGDFQIQTGEIEFRQKISINSERSFVTPFNCVFQLAQEAKRGDILFSPSIQNGNATVILKSKNDQFALSDSISADTPCISPAKVMGFWNPAFNNTNLATRDFERRMPEIHKTCNNDVLELYVQNLDKPISTIDQKVSEMGYPQFEVFAKENIGKVDTKNPHYAGLKAFYDKSVSALKADAKRNIEDEQARQKAWKEFIAKERQKEVARSMQRISANIVDDANFNRKNTIAQIRKSNGFTIRRGSFGSRTARLNCDAPRRYLAAIQKVAVNAEEGSTAPILVAPTSFSKTIIIAPEYNEFKVKVPNADKYIKLYAYVFAHSVNSYQRISGNDGTFTCRLNANNLHDIGIVGVTEDGYEYFQKMTVKDGDLGEVKMKIVSERKLEASINQLNNKRIRRPMDISQELNWLKAERKNYKVDKDVQDMKAFRESIKIVIFPCYSQFDCEADSKSINPSIDVAEEIKEEDSIEVLAE